MTDVATIASKYAEPIADSAGLDLADYDQNAAGLAKLLRDTAADLTPLDQTRGWLEDAAADLDAIARLGDDGPKTGALLARIDSALYDATSELDA